MRRYLVVANQTLGGEHLKEKVRECLAAGPCEFHILVPATPPAEHLTATEGQARKLAQQRLDAACEEFRAMGATCDGEVGDARPLTAIADVLRHLTFDELILSTLPAGPSRWLKQDLPHWVERTFDLPVTHIVAEAAAAPA